MFYLHIQYFNDQSGSYPTYSAVTQWLHKERGPHCGA